MGKPFYLTTTLPYVNSDPHLGFAIELVHADILARYRASQGDEVFFNTGTDEHGLKIYRKALEAGKDPKAYVDEYAAKFKALKEKLNLFPDLHFVRTTDPGHKKAAQELWRRCLKNCDIYKKKYKGLYCVGDEAFLKESDLVGGTCPNHPTMEPIEIEEENYFFRLSAYQDRLLEYLGREDVVVPEWRRLEAVQFVQKGLEDFSISRVKEKMPWGVPVPEDDSQILYVWFDALTNYISTLGWPADKDGNFHKFWENGETLQIAGKDQVRFQSIMWQAMLMSAHLPTTQRVVYHGFITSGGHKMSKSVGNVIDPLAIVDEDGVDALRYFLARHIHPFEDSDFTMERFKNAYNADLANGIGNLAARILTLAEANLSAPVISVKRKVPKEYSDAFNAFSYNRAVEYIWDLIAALDGELTVKKPFALVKENPDEGRAMISDMVLRLHEIAALLAPFVPSTSSAIQQAIAENKKPPTLFPRKN